MDLTVEQARRRATGGRVARLATVDPRGAPHIVPVTFAVEDDTVFMAVDQKPKSTRELTRLRNIRSDPRVSVLVDQYDDEDWARLWWVRADGVASIMAGDETAAANALALLVAKYRQYLDDPPTGPFIGVAVQRWRGWQFAEA